MKKTPKIEKACYEMGRAAFARGVACAPALDVEFGKLPPLPIGKESLCRLTSWHAGWTAANLDRFDRHANPWTDEGAGA